MRVVSLLPSATEIVFALNEDHLLAGRSHECDYPPEAARVPIVTRTNIPADLSSAQIDTAVGGTLTEIGSLYELDLPLLEELQPDLILTQRLCDVCAVSADRVQDAVAGLKSRPRILNLEPHSLEDILENIRTVGEAIGCRERARHVIGALRRRIAAVAETSARIAVRPRVVCLEWVDPPYCAGHWMKELVELAGGRDDVSNLHRPSYRIDWRRVLDFAPEVIVLTCCGFGLERNLHEAQILAGFDGAASLPAFQAGRVYATDGSSYFARPGPRIVDSLEILAHCIHPDAFPPPRLPDAYARVELTKKVPLAEPVAR